VSLSPETLQPAVPASKARAGVEVRLEELRRLYAGVTALDGLSLTIGPGELVALLGPSGCGKTTALRLVAGLEEANSGRVVIGGNDVTNLGANKREIGMVFQAYSLFPHMTATQNVEFGMQLHKVGAADRRKRAREMLELVGLSAHANKYASQLSGGQQQRVALARALAIEPKVLLLDEPLSALDAKVRSRLRDEIRRVQLEVGITTLFVTHDQEEALAIADRVGVMNKGRLEQLGPPTTIYSRPATPFVAEFVGLTNRLAGQVRGGEVEVRGARLPLVKPDTPDGPAIALVRPETVSMTSDGDIGAGPMVGSVIAVAFLGATSRVTVDLGDVIVLAQMPTAEAAAHPAGTRVRLNLRPDPVLIARDEKTADEA
jgi:putative spermidine/putrescine transport system ATP-binding protein